MNLLQEAETLDSFFSKVNRSAANLLARYGNSYVPMKDPVPWILNTKIVEMHPSAESGLPHTRPPNLICMPLYFPEHRYKETLIHELIHIDQRRRKPLWDAKFMKEGWSPLDESLIPERWYNQCRLNPDTIDSRFWAFEKQHVPLPLFERADKPDLRQVRVFWWDMETGIRQLEAPRRFQERYGPVPSQPEHPRELSAVELAKIFQSPSDIDQYLQSK
jgi:hypothetical protein